MHRCAGCVWALNNYIDALSYVDCISHLCMKGIRFGLAKLCPANCTHMHAECVYEDGNSLPVEFAMLMTSPDSRRVRVAWA